MGRSEARIHVSIWQDDDFLALPALEQHAYFLVLSQSLVSMCGVVPLQVRAWASMSAGGTAEAMRRALDGLANERFVVIDDQTEELWVRTLVKHDGILRSPNLIVAMTRDFGGIRSKRIRAAFLEGLGQDFLASLPEGLAERLATPFLWGFRELFHFDEVRYRSPTANPSEGVSHACAPGAHSAEPPSPSPSPSPPPYAPPGGPQETPLPTPNGQSDPTSQPDAPPRFLPPPPSRRTLARQHRPGQAP